jgi:hypothetical protein
MTQYEEGSKLRPKLNSYVIDTRLILVLFETLSLLFLSLFDKSNHEHKQYYGINVL